MVRRACPQEASPAAASSRRAGQHGAGTGGREPGEGRGREEGAGGWEGEAAEAARECVEAGMWEELGRLGRHLLPLLPPRLQLLLSEELLSPLDTRVAAPA